MDKLIIDTESIYIDLPDVTQNSITNPESITCWLQAIAFILLTGKSFTSDGITIERGLSGLVVVKINGDFISAMTPTECVKFIFHEINEKMCPINVSIKKDGDQYCALLGFDLQIGIAGFGETIEDSITDFCSNWLNALPSVRANAIESINEGALK